MSIDIFDELDFEEIGKPGTFSPQSGQPVKLDAPPPVPSMLAKKIKLTARQMAKSPMAQGPVTNKEINLCVKIQNDKFIIAGNAIILSGLLSDWRKKNPEQNEIILNSADMKLNSANIMKYIVQYLNMWADYYPHCDYNIKRPIRTSDVSQVLYSQDWRFIHAYIAAEAQPVQVIPIEAGFMEHAQSLNLKTKSEIAAIVKLLDQATYLKIDTLEKKLYVYAAALLYDKTAVDIAAGTPR